MIAGARGLVGQAALEYFGRLDDVSVIALSRGALNVGHLATPVRVDLTDRDGTMAALEPHRDATHLVYAAVYERPQLVDGWSEPEHLEVNATMFRNIVDALDSPRLQHVSLLQGSKAYGIHVNPVAPLPCKERAPRVEHANFYFEQEDFLKDRQATRNFTFSILRPQIVLGVASGGAMNIVASLGVYASIMKALGRPLDFPGAPNYFEQTTDANLLAEAIDWAMRTPACANQTFNINNGDILCFWDVWPRLAKFFGLPLGKPVPCNLAEQMPKHDQVWRDLAQLHGLPPDLSSRMESSWQFSDITWAYPEDAPRPIYVSTIKARKFGFRACLDSEDRLFDLLEEMQRRHLLPP